MRTQLSRVPCEGGVQLAVHLLGGNGPPLVVLAANGFIPKAYLPLVTLLKAHFTCYGVDLRGHGDSPSGPGTDLLYHGSDVATVVQKLGLRGGYAFGHCLGGYAAVHAELLQPGSFCQIITYEPILYHMNSHDVGWDHPRWKAPTLLQKAVSRRQRYFKSRQEVRQRLAGRPPWNRFCQESLDMYIEHGFRDVSDGVELKTNPAVVAAGMLWPPHLDPMHTVYPALGKVQCPVSILAGTDVSATNPTEFVALFIEEATQHFSKGRFERLEGLQHLGPMEDPARVAARILSHADKALYKRCSSMAPSRQHSPASSQPQAQSRL
ncbi:hypothetical protein WJX74_007981 [Apatococcus lobatus]|uniref:AB hydrolase-1 domain-containing protein n=1 Tax=Apatococcus lobatus TaxID=904363 RepID=A0AAW1RR39_9CHLO